MENKSTPSDWLSLKKLWPFLGPQKKLILISAVLVPFMGFSQLALPMILAKTVDRGIVARDLNAIKIGVIIFFVFVVLDYVLKGFQTVLSQTAVHRMIREMRRETLTHVLALPLKFHDKNMSGNLTTRLTSDVDNLSESLNQGVLNSIADLAVLGSCLIGMFILNFKLAAIVLVVFPVIFFTVQWFSKMMRQSMILARKKSAIANGFAQECLVGLTTVKLLNAQETVGLKYQKYAHEFRDAQMKSVWLDSVLFAILDGLSSVTFGLVLWVVAHYYFAMEALSAGVLVGFAQYLQQIFEPLKQLSNKIALLQGAFASIDRVFSLLNEPAFESSKKSNSCPDLKSAAIEFNNVTFSYQDPAKPELKNISFKILPHQTVALIGKTGGGKSTIVKLLSQLYQGYGGSIAVGGVELSSIQRADFLRHVGFVPQDVVIFEGSIEFNISLNRKGISLDAVKRAAEVVGADQFIEKFSDQYNHLLKEGGSNLSHGQRQLIIFARALANDPDFIILDEATSSVDPESERMIQEATLEIFKSRTVLVIAHRLSTIESADQTIVIANGSLINT